MTRAELVSKLAEATGLTRARADAVVTALFESIGEQLAAGERVTVPGFGTLTVVERPARQGRHPRTGEVIFIDRSRVVRFRSGTNLARCLGSLEGDGTIPPFRPGRGIPGGGRSGGDGA